MSDDARRLGDGDAPPSRLAELLECERELADLITRAREEARGRVAAAHAQAAQDAADLEASLEEESERVRRQIREESQARIRDIATRARELVARFDGVSDEGVERLAGTAFRQLIGADQLP